MAHSLVHPLVRLHRSLTHFEARGTVNGYFFMCFYFLDATTYRVVKKKVSFGIFSIIKTTYDIDFFTVKITDKILSLSKF